MPMKYIAIAAISENRAIGKDGKIPWYIPEDFKHFKESTSGSPIIMGRKTYESIGRPLPWRENIVLSRKGTNFEGTTSIKSIDELEEYLKKNWKSKAYICWGSEIYKLFFDDNKTDKVILSRIKMNVEWADAFFPEFENDFMLEKTDEREEFTIEYWKRKL
jgi:dihydrofolate reductase